MDKNFKRIVGKKCVICGKGFGVEISPEGEILTDCFYNTLDLNYFDGWVYELISTDKLNFDDNLKIRFKNKFYKIVGFSKITQEIVYFLWKIFHKKIKFEFWECPKCANRPDDA